MLAVSTRRRLQRLLILYEAPEDCRKHFLAAGRPKEVAAEIAFYLAQASDFEVLVEPVQAAFAPQGIEVVALPLEARDRWLPLLTDLRYQATLVWCLTDGFAYYRGSFVASAAALLGVAQFGSPPAAQHLAQDKFRCLALAQALGVRTPPTVLVEDGAASSPWDVLPEGAPLFVKPAMLGAKLGIEGDSLAPDRTTALAVAGRIHARYGDRALIQRYIPGRDVRVSFMELEDAAPTLGIYGIDTGVERGFSTLADSRRVTRLRAAGAGLKVSNLRHEPALAAASVAALEDAVRRIARVVRLRDYFSLDFRLDEAGRPWFLELEVCPAVTIYDFLTYLREAYGVDLPGALARAAPLAFARRIAAAGG